MFHAVSWSNWLVSSCLRHCNHSRQLCVPVSNTPLHLTQLRETAVVTSPGTQVVKRPSHWPLTMQGGLLREIKHNVFLNSASNNLAGRQTTHIDSRRSNLPPHTSHHTSLLPHTSLTVETRVYDVQHATSADTHTDIQTNRNTGRQARWRPETVGCDVIRSHAVVGHNTTHTYTDAAFYLLLQYELQTQWHWFTSHLHSTLYSSGLFRMILSDLVKYSMTWSIARSLSRARSLCDSWASCMTQARRRNSSPAIRCSGVSTVKSLLLLW